MLDDRYAPLTSAIGFVEAPLADVARAVEEWRRGLHRKVRVAAAKGFPEMLRALEPLTTTAQPRELLVEARNGWTAYFTNGLPAPDVTSPVRHITLSMHWAGLMVTCNQPGTNQFGAVQMELFAPVLTTEFLNTARAVSVTQDGSRWQFDAHGAVQPFEEVERYGARRVRDRFTPDMLERYCAALGIELFDPGWYGPAGVLVESKVVMGHGAKAMTLAQAQEWLGIVPG